MEVVVVMAMEVVEVEGTGMEVGMGAVDSVVPAVGALTELEGVSEEEVLVGEEGEGRALPLLVLPR